MITFCLNTPYRTVKTLATSLLQSAVFLNEFAFFYTFVRRSASLLEGWYLESILGRCYSLSPVTISLHFTHVWPTAWACYWIQRYYTNL